MSGDFQIRSYEDSDKEPVLTLHRTVFSYLTSESWQEGYVKRLERQLTSEKTVVVLDGNTIVGLVSGDRFKDLDYNDLVRIQDRILLAHLGWHYLNVRENLRTDVINKERQGLGKAVLEVFREAAEEYPFSIHGDSFFATDFAVHPHYQNRDLGFKLAEYAVELARKNRAPRIYAQIIDSPSVKSICEKLGFRPLLKWGPVYENGEAAMIISKVLFS